MGRSPDRLGTGSGQSPRPDRRERRSRLDTGRRRPAGPASSSRSSRFVARFSRVRRAAARSLVLTAPALVLADLSRPRVEVAIDVPGHGIGAPGWADMPLSNGGFSSGTAGTDYLGGNFHGAGHEEAWGVFETANYLGAFGAKREP